MAGGGKKQGIKKPAPETRRRFLDRYFDFGFLHQIESIQSHYLRPGTYKVLDKLLLGIIGGIELSYCTQL